MLYVILLLVVVVGLLAFYAKKRSAEQKNTAKPIAKKSGSKTKLVETAIATQKKTTPLGYELRNNIETLIQEQNFFSAEAQINQALNRDNTQHELYLFLLDIHILQKDEFAISQLINHIRSLELDEILTQAEQKKAAYDVENKAPVNDTVEYHKDDVDIGYRETAVTEPDTTEKDTEFDALMASPTSTDSQALNFDFSAEKATTPETPAPAFEFESFNFDSNQLSSSSSSSLETEKAAATETEFNTELSTAQVDTPVVEPTLEMPALNLDFSTIETDPIATPSVPEQDSAPAPAADLDFSFSTATSPEVAAPESPVEDSPVRSTETNLDFNFSVTAEAPVASVVETPVEAGPNLDFNLSGAPVQKVAVAVETINEQDPLVKSFPELMQANEIQLNLDLAKQYIQLGAVDAARELLADSEAKFSVEQQQQAQVLLNQIA